MHSLVLKFHICSDIHVSQSGNSKYTKIITLIVSHHVSFLRKKKTCTNIINTSEFTF